MPVNRYGCFVLFGEEAECITGVQDRLGDGHALFVFDRIWPIGEKVWDTEVGYIDEEGQEQKSNDCGRFLVTGYSTHEAAKQIAAKTLGAGLPLMSGFWHEVVSD